MNEEIVTPTFFELYAVYIKILGQFFSHTLLTIHRSVGSYKYHKNMS